MKSSPDAEGQPLINNLLLNMREPLMIRALAMLLSVFALGFSSLGHTAELPVNVIVILADDLGSGDLACFGHPRFKTPRLDRMADEGARLTHCYSTCAFCAPSRASLLTGRYPFRHGMTRNPAPDAGIDDVGIASQEITLGEAFQKAGYATCCIGKWHLGHKPEFYPTRHGFEQYLGILYSNDMRPVELFRNGRVLEPLVDQRFLTTRYTAAAIEFIERNVEHPFFLYLPHAMPHKPLAASELFYEKSGAGLYGDVIAELDDNIGRLLDRLDELRLSQRTLVLFTSDNGPWYGGSTGGLRGMKGETWEGGVRVPLIARWPGTIPAGQTNDDLASLVDFFPTALAAADVALPNEVTFDGRDLLPRLTSNAAGTHEAVFAMRGEKIGMVRSGRWKLHLDGTPALRTLHEDWVDPRAPDGKTIFAQTEQARPSEHPGITTGDTSRESALFDLHADPSEQKNIADEHPDVVERLKKLARQAETDAG